MASKRDFLIGIKGAAALLTMGLSLVAEKVVKTLIKKFRKGEEDPVETSEDFEKTFDQAVELEQESSTEENHQLDEAVDQVVELEQKSSTEEVSVRAIPPDPRALDQLKALSDLHAVGALSDEEFESKKQDLLKRI
tara:strand:- start:26 stop:433 length:408 start_codon:yes stop_codon:yes gene_type:complete